MSEIQIFHYRLADRGPDAISFPNAQAFLRVLTSPAGLIEAYFNPPNDDLTVFRDAFNEYQRGDRKDWQKIAAGFLSDYSLVLDEDRAAVVQALTSAYSCFQDQGPEHPFPGVYNQIQTLGRGPIVVTVNTDHGGVLHDMVVSKTDLARHLEQITPDDVLRSRLDAILDANERQIWRPSSRIVREIPRATTLPRYIE